MDALWKIDRGPKLRQFNRDLNAFTRRISEQEQMKMSTQTSNPSKDDTFVMAICGSIRPFLFSNESNT